MAGHSKWANIQHRKGRQDEKRGKLWTKLIREITVSARAGGPDATTNPRLRLALDKGTDANMPKDTMTRAIQRGAGGADGVSYDEIRYEGYGINGAAIIVDTITRSWTLRWKPAQKMSLPMKNAVWKCCVPRQTSPR